MERLAREWRGAHAITPGGRRARTMDRAEWVKRASPRNRVCQELLRVSARERERERAYIHIQRDGERQGRRANAVLPLSNENLWPSASKRGRRRHASDGLIWIRCSRSICQRFIDTEGEMSPAFRTSVHTEYHSGINDGVDRWQY